MTNSIPRIFLMAVFGDVMLGKPLGLRQSSGNQMVVPIAEVLPETCETQHRCFSIKTIGAVAGISRSTVQREIQAGRLKARKIGRRIIITHADAMAYLNSLRAVDSKIFTDALDDSPSGGRIEDAP